MLERIENILRISLGNIHVYLIRIMEQNKNPSEIFKEKLFNERKSGTPFASYWVECPDICMNPGLSRGYRLYKLLQVVEKEDEQTSEREERDIKESE